MYTDRYIVRVNQCHDYYAVCNIENHLFKICFLMFRKQFNFTNRSSGKILCVIVNDGQTIIMNNCFISNELHANSIFLLINWAQTLMGARVMGVP